MNQEKKQINYYLSIETSCDETSLALFSVEQKNKESKKIHHFTVISHEILSQIDIHKEFGGVFPEIAKREHAKSISPLCEHIFLKGGFFTKEKKEEYSLEHFSEEEKKMYSHAIEKNSMLGQSFLEHIACYKNCFLPLSGIFVTAGPGLSPSLWVGISFAKLIGTFFSIPIIPVNHMQGHIFSVYSKEISFEINTDSFFPHLSLLISGGHTEFVYQEKEYSYLKIGKTKDDAVGEAFDKVARMLSIPYPGGALLSQKAALYRKELQKTNTKNTLIFPRPLIHEKSLDFSFSGLKTAVRYFLEKETTPLSEERENAIACAFEDAVCDVLVKKTCEAYNLYPAASFSISGGVSANNFIKESIFSALQKISPSLFLYAPQKGHTGDNALMIGIAGYMNMQNPLYKHKDIYSIHARSNWSIDEEYE